MTAATGEVPADLTNTEAPRISGVIMRVLTSLALVAAVAIASPLALLAWRIDRETIERIVERPD